MYLEQMKSLINNIYEKISYNLNSNNIINNNISLFVKNNINDIAKLNEINKQINLFYKKRRNIYINNCWEWKIKKSYKRNY